jgi:enterochelin esterase-like enzyme
MRRALVAMVAAGWLAVGLYGAWAYGHDYFLYRGFAPPRDPQGIAAGRLVVHRFYSRALGRQDQYAVYEPPGYLRAARAGARLPVLYLLHGDHAGYMTYVRAGALGVQYDVLAAHRLIRPFLVVMPRGRDGTFVADTEWSDTGRGYYGSYVVDVVRDADRHFATVPRRAGRALAGLSMGGYAAVNLLLRHLDVFSAAESWSGYFRQTRAGPYAKATAAELRAASPRDYAPSLRDGLRRSPIRVLLDGGRGDPESRQIQPFARELRGLGATVQSIVFPGRHDWRFWRGNLNLGLRWASRAFNTPPGPLLRRRGRSARPAPGGDPPRSARGRACRRCSSRASRRRAR